MLGVRFSEQWPWEGKVRIFTFRRDAHGRFLPAEQSVRRNLIVDSGKNAIRDVLQGVLADAKIRYLAVGTGLGHLTVGLTNGQAGIVSLTVSALSSAIAANASITLQTPTASQVVTVTAAGAAAGATSIPVNSFTANAAYPATTSYVSRTPGAGQTALDNEQFRKAITSYTPSNDQLVCSTYLAPSEAINLAGGGFDICEFGWFAGTGATGTAGSGILVARMLYCKEDKTNQVSVRVDRTDSW